jgi:hypothetical protein
MPPVFAHLRISVVGQRRIRSCDMTIHDHGLCIGRLVTEDLKTAEGYGLTMAIYMPI